MNDTKTIFGLYRWVVMRGVSLCGIATVLVLMSMLDAVAAEPPVEVKSDSNDRGALIFRASCATCHENPASHAPPTSALRLLSRESIVSTLTVGVMKAQGSGLSEEDKSKVAAFLHDQDTVTVAEKESLPICASDKAQFNFDEPPAFTGWGVTYANARLIPSELAGIDKANVATLKLKWAFGFPGAVRVRSQPAIAGGALYTGSNDGTVYALERKTGCLRWRFQATTDVRTSIVVTPWSAGNNSAAPWAYFGDIAGNVYAVDAISGVLKWRARADSHPRTVVTGTPVLFEDKLFVPVASLEETSTDPHYECCTFRGSLVAYNARSGKELWRTYTVGPPKLTGTNSVGAKMFAPSGAAIWSSPTVDAGRRQIYFGTGNNYSSPSTNTSDAIFALDLDSGKVRWIHQASTGDAWNVGCVTPKPILCPKDSGHDTDFGGPPILAHASNGRDFIVAGQKSGVVSALDPDTGNLVWAKRLGRGGVFGGVLFGMAINGDTVFVPINDMNDGQPHDSPSRSGLYAVNLLDGSSVWEAPSSAETCVGRVNCSSGIGVAITATPDFVFTGENDGWFRVIDSSTGHIVWHYDTTQAVSTVNGVTASGGAIGGAAGPIAYRGTLVVPSGYALIRTMPGNVLLVFGVDDAAATASR